MPVMKRPCHIAVIADDLTGAADTGMQFCPAVGPVYLTPAGGELSDAAVAAAGVAVFTHSRHVAAAMAAAAVRRAWETIRGLAPQVVYKKIDSCLRGNLGAEIDALLQAGGFAASFVVPALPRQGRTTVNDCHCLHGVPVAATEIGRDPLGPVKESRLSVLLSAQSRLPVGHVDLACIEAGGVELVRQVQTLLDRGCRHITFDAARSGHLDAVAHLMLDRFERILPVGSGGLAGSLARHLGCKPPGPATGKRPKIHRWLFVCGSASQVLAQQVAALARSTGWTHLSLEPAALTAGKDASLKAPSTVAEEDAWRAGGLIVSLRPISETGPVEDPDRVVRGLAHVAAGLVRRGQPQAVFLSGGDTAEAVWARSGAAALIIREAILPGLMRGEFVGGRFDGLPVVTKAGAFGQAETLNQLVNSLK